MPAANPAGGQYAVGLIFSNQRDAFFSYAHDDNVLNDRVVTQFRPLVKERFEAEMRRHISLPHHLEADIFMDKIGLPANGDLSDELKSAIDASVFLFIFVGLSYPRSTWCGRELEHFMRKFSGDRQDALKRTFVVVLERDAVSAKWGARLDEPERPLYETLFDDVSGNTIPFVVDEEGTAHQNPRLTSRLRRVVQTMRTRALNLLKKNSGA